MITIITPCTRVQNLQKIAESINIPSDKYRWIIVVDADVIPQSYPKECEIYAYMHDKSRMGNAQRNFALDMITEGMVYFNDDDTTLHPDLWKYIKNVKADMISFDQSWKEGMLRLSGKEIRLGHTDSHNFITDRKVIGNTKWVLDRYDADGLFAEECRRKSKSFMYIPKILSVYNSLR